MAGTGTAHLRDAERRPAARRGPRRRVPRRPHRPEGQRRQRTSASTCSRARPSASSASPAAASRTTGRAIMQLPRPDRRLGALRRHGAHRAVGRATCAQARTRMQMIFQDPISSLNPRRKVARHRRWSRSTSGSVGTADERAAKVDEVLDEVGIDPQRAAERQPHQFSGGQCQRISIARALVLDPKLIICDEPVSALDVSVQAQILNLLEDLKARYGLTLVFIAHDLAVVKNVSDRVAVMYLGKICEVAPSRRRCTRARRTPTPRRCSTRSRCPTPRSRSPRPRSRANRRRRCCPPTGCRFNPRCPRRRTSAAARSRSSRASATATSWPATSPPSPRWSSAPAEQRTREPNPQHVRVGLTQPPSPGTDRPCRRPAPSSRHGR